MPYQHPPIELRSGPTFIGSGPIASAPDAGTWWAKAPGKIGGLYYNTVATDDTPVGPCVAVRSFHNEGTDYGDWGRPANIINSIRPLFDNFSICFSGAFANNTAGQYFFGIGNGSNTLERQLGFRRNSNIGDSQLAVNIGGLYINTGVSIPHSKLVNICVSFSFAGELRVFIDGVLVFSGSFVGYSYADATHAITIGGLDSLAPSFLNAECDSIAVKICSGYAENADFLRTLNTIAQFNANDPAKWSGGESAVDSAGNPITFIDGTPLGRVAYSWVSLAKAQEWGLLT